MIHSHNPRKPMKDDPHRLEWHVNCMAESVAQQLGRRLLLSALGVTLKDGIRCLVRGPKCAAEEFARRFERDVINHPDSLRELQGMKAGIIVRDIDSHGCKCGEPHAEVVITAEAIK